MIFATPNRGTGGAGAQGILQGLMAGQQSRESDKRMEFLQTQQDRATEQYESGESNSRYYNMKEVYNAGGNIAPLLDSYNKWRKDTTNFADGDDFRVGNWDDYKTEGGGINQAAQNQWSSDTGFDFDEKTTARRPIMMGDKFFNFDTFSAAAPKFKAYSQDRDLERATTIAKINKANRSEEKQSDADALNDAKTVKKYYDDNNLEVPLAISDKIDILETKTSISQPQAIDKISSGVFNKPIDNWMKDGGSLSKTTRDDARKNQNRAGYKMDGRKEMAKEISGYGAMNDAKKKVFQLLDSKDGILTGVIQNKELELLKRKEDWNTLDKGQKQKAINSVFAKSTLGTAVSNYLKAISGSAVAEEEYQRIYDALTGGEGANPETLKAALGGSVGSMRDTVSSNVQNIGKNYPNSRIEMWDSFIDARDRKVNAFKDVPRAKETGGTQTTTAAAADVPGELGADIIDSGGNIFRSLYNKVTGNDKDTDKDKVPTTEEVLKLPNAQLGKYLLETGDTKKVQQFLLENSASMGPERVAKLVDTLNKLSTGRTE